MEKNKYQQEAYELLSKMISPNIQDFETRFLNDKGEMRLVTFRVCKVNGTKYVKASSIHYDFLSMFKFMRKKGYLNENDIIYFLDNNKISVFVEARKLKLFNQQIADMFKGGFNQDYQVLPVINAAWDSSVVDTHIDALDLVESQKAYKRRKELLRKSKELMASQQQEREKEREVSKEVRLKELVREIESMGWKVTLSLKNG